MPLEKTGQFGIAPHSSRIYLHYKDNDPPFICLNLDLVVDSGHLLMLMDTTNITFLHEDMEKGIYWLEGRMDSTRDLLKVDTLLNRAYIAARKARFEFMESGKSIDEALRLYNPTTNGWAPYFSPEALASARALENEALKGKGDGFKMERTYIIGECISAWVQPGATVTVIRASRGIRFREYRNIFYLQKDEYLTVIDIKTEEIFNSFKQKAGPSLDELMIARIEYDNSYHIIGIVKEKK